MMQTNKDNIPKRRRMKFTNIPYEQEQFDLHKYLDNPYLIEKLHKEMNTTVLYVEHLTIKIETMSLKKQELEFEKVEFQLKLEEKDRIIQNKILDTENINKELIEKRKILEEILKKNHKLEMEKNEIDIKLKGINQLSFLTYITSAIAGFAVTLGGNFIVSMSNVLAGWILATLGTAIGIIAYFMSRRGK